MLALVAAYYGLQDPPTANLCRYLRSRGWRVAVVLRAGQGAQEVIVEAKYFLPEARIRCLASLTEFFNWGRVIKKAVRDLGPDLFISFMVHPWVSAGCLGQVRRVCCIYDIPPAQHAGILASSIYRNAWKNLGKLDYVWSSDPLKAQLCKVRGRLETAPPVCHNVPYSDYIDETELGSGRTWLCARLAAQDVMVEQGQKILLRAGAFGVLGGIEETLAALVKNPTWVFVLMGRPDSDYEVFVRAKVAELNLKSQVGFIVRPSNDEWRKALLGADAGHLIHLRPDDGYHREAFDNNSPLSTNRLFQYMAAKLPIISSDDSRMAEIHREIDCFLVAEAANLVKSLDHILKRLRSDTFIDRNMGKAGRSAHLNKYNWEDQFAPIFESINFRRNS